MKQNRFLVCMIWGVLTAAISAVPVHAQFRLLHAFGGGANDGAMPIWGSSLVVTGTTLYGVTASGGPSTNGVVFKVNTNGTGFQVLRGFNGFIPFLNPTGSKDDGAVPYGTPLLDGSVLYGMTAQGGSNGFGTVWRMNTDGSQFQVLHHFGGGVDGRQPVGSLVRDGSTLYGLTSGGGSNSAIGVLFKLDTNGTGYQILRHFDVNNNGILTPYGSPLLANGRLYGTTRLGGMGGGGGIWAIDVDGNNYQVLHTFTGTALDGWQPNGSLIIDGTTLYGMAQYGGANNAGIIFQIQTNGSGFQILHHFAMTEAHTPQGDLIRDGATLYGFTKGGVTNIFGSNLGGGAIIQINTDGSNYRQLHTFLFPIRDPDGQWPYGAPLKIGTKLFGMTQLGGSFLGNNQGTVFVFDLTGAGGGGGGGGTTAPVYDMAVSSIKPTKTVTLTDSNPAVTKRVKVRIQNRGNQNAEVLTAMQLGNLIQVELESLGACPSPEAVLPFSVTFKPFTIKPKRFRNVIYEVTFDCANDPLKNSKSDTGHEDYSYTARVDQSALGTGDDSVPENDTCPRPPNPALGDPGCGMKNPDKTLGAPVTTDVVQKE